MLALGFGGVLCGIPLWPWVQVVRETAGMDGTSGMQRDQLPLEESRGPLFEFVPSISLARLRDFLFSSSFWRFSSHSLMQNAPPCCCCCCCCVASVVSNSVRPHRRQPARLPHPWDSPGKNTGVGCHFLLQCMELKSESEVAQSCPTLSNPMDCSPPGSSAMGFSRQEC